VNVLICPIPARVRGCIIGLNAFNVGLITTEYIKPINISLNAVVGALSNVGLLVQIIQVVPKLVGGVASVGPKDLKLFSVYVLNCILVVCVVTFCFVLFLSLTPLCISVYVYLALNVRFNNKQTMAVQGFLVSGEYIILAPPPFSSPLFPYS